MIRVSVGPPVIELIKLGYWAKRAMMLIGQTGGGKSASFEEAARALKIESLVIDLSLLEAPDLTGLPVIEDGRTTFAPPSFLPTSGKGLLVFEELNRAPRYTQAPCFQLLTARRLNEYELPEGWLPVGAINPDEDAYMVEAMDAALLARFMVIHVEPNVRHWIAWAEANGVHPAVMEYVKSTTDVFKKATDSNPRAWVYVSDILHAHESNGSSRGTLAAAVAGFVGGSHARAFLRIYHSRSGIGVPPVASLLTSYGRGRTKVLSIVKAGDTARLSALSRNVLLHLQEPANEAAVQSCAKTMANLAQFVADLPADFRRKIRSEYPWVPAAPKRKAKPKRTKKKRGK